jgi:S-adenosyl-L-methionine hydrolase (adenosine-forming)
MDRLPVSVSPPLITLLTDFGTADYFVAAVKGVILAANPSAAIVDITHDIPAHDIEAAAFTLLACYQSFPTNTIHVAVVDPGVGSTRRAILISTGNQFFVGPDNGIFSFVLENEPAHKTFHITAEKYFHHPVSSTFHGRDVFAPVAAALSNGIEPNLFGPEIDDDLRLAPFEPHSQEDGRVKGRIIHIDRFGNCVTNITRKFLSEEKQGRAKLVVKGKTIDSFREFFSAQDKPRTSLFAIWGSAGFLEIATKNRSAARLLGVKRGETIILDCRERLR